jgi:hypothetical protein
MCDLCGQRHADKTPPASDTEKDFFNLVHELVRLLGEDELFTFVLHPEVEGTNNETERTLRNPSQARQTGRTSQTPRGARRRTILQSVIESLRLRFRTRASRQAAGAARRFTLQGKEGGGQRSNCDAGAGWKYRSRSTGRPKGPRISWISSRENVPHSRSRPWTSP